MLKSLLFFVLLSSLFNFSISTKAQAYPDAVVTIDEGGPVQLYGHLAYTNPLFTVGVAEPLVLLEDQTGFIQRNRDYVLPIESQTLGRITSDFMTSPFEYTLSLPVLPQAILHNFGSSNDPSQGVAVYSIAYWTNAFGDAYLEQRDQYGVGWSTAYSSVRVHSDAARDGEVWGGKLLIYSSSTGQLFPMGFGPDELLFTEDDPLMIAPQGYSVVNLDEEPFTLDRSRDLRVDILEGEAAEADDFSSLSYVDAFDKMLQKLRREYAFTEFRNIDWDALDREYRPRFEAATRDNDVTAYFVALRDFTWEIPDGHVDSNIANALFNQFIQETDGGIGIALRVLDDGRTIANFVLPDSPADQAGIQRGAEILALNGQAIGDAIAGIRPWSGRFSTAHVDALQQMRYVTRFRINDPVTLTFRNQPGQPLVDVSLTAVAERESFEFSSFNLERSGFELPVQYRLLPSGMLYVQITSFADDERLTIDLWERLLSQAKRENVAGIILDMRLNGGGSAWLADQMAAYFFNEVQELGNIGFYDPELDDFYFEPSRIKRFYLPDAALRYDGPLAVLVGPDCSSACEFFSYNLTLQDRAVIVGQYPSGGLGGSIEQFFMPGPVTIQFTNGRAVDAQGQIHIEGQGVVPDLRVPVTQETILSSEDAVLQAAEAYLTDLTSLRIVERGDIEYESITTAQISVNERLYYRVTLPAQSVSVFVVTDTAGQLDTVLRIRDASAQSVLASNDDFNGSLNSAILGFEAGAEDLDVIIEVATYNDSFAGEFNLRAGSLPVTEDDED